MNNSYITIIKEKRTALSRKRIPLNQNGCTANFRIGVPFEQNLHSPGGVVTDIPLVMPPSDEFGFGRTSMLLNFSGELAMPEDLADAILFLASDQSRYVNGEELKCDGGWTCF